jgi:multiple sugar transport system substrate-binding protein
MKAENLAWLALMLVLMVTLTGCGPKDPTEVKDFVTWYQYDQGNEDPASDERAGNQYLRDSIAQFNEEFEGKWNWINVPKAFDKRAAELVAAVQAGGDTPDAIHVGADEITLLHRNGALQDLTEWAQQQEWYKELESNGIEACKGPDGRLYCIPISQIIYVTYVWADRFPYGYPTTPEEFETEASRLKAEGLYAITFFGSTAYDGDGASRAIWTFLTSFGGGYDDGQGNLTLNTPGNVAAIEWLRGIIANGYAPEVVFAGGFQEEEAFKDASAASIPTGLYGYRYMNPLTAPNGTKYETRTEQDMLDAIDAGDVYLSPFFGANGHKPGCGLSIEGLAIATGAKNVDAAHDYINWIMSPEHNAQWVALAGGGFPVLKPSLSDEVFQTTFYRQATEVAEASACRPWYGTLERSSQARPLIMAAIYKLIKEDPTADIAAELQKVEDEYNAGN